MNVCGIIAEYNPFHNGHKYHLQKAIQNSGADYTIVIMSGNFMQRGTPAIIDKYTRAHAALISGADLVLQLPSCYSTGSAEYFATGAVSLLDQLNTVTHLCFGSECGDILLMKKIAQIYVEEPAAFQESLRFKLKTGLSFPVARAAALMETYPEFSSSLSVLSSPNNILGIEYIKALLKRSSSIDPITISRSGSGYHDRELFTPLSSAAAIRQAIETGVNLGHLTTHIPPEVSEIYEYYFTDSEPIFLDDFSQILHYKLMTERDMGFASYLDVSEDLSDRIKKNIYRFTDFGQFCDLLKTKELTYARICRCLMHILLNIKKSDVQNYICEMNYVPYARVLGFKKEAAPLLHKIRKHSSIPLISKLADADKILNEPALKMLQDDIHINDIYSSVRAGKNEALMMNEYSTPIVII